MKHKLLPTIFVLLVFIGTINFTKVEPAHAFAASAYKVEIAYWYWGEPHYGAFFQGSYGSGQWYTGPSGTPPGYSTWNWWGSAYHVLLLDKSWLFTHWDGFTASNHHAYMSP